MTRGDLVSFYPEKAGVAAAARIVHNRLREFVPCHGRLREIFLPARYSLSTK